MAFSQDELNRFTFSFINQIKSTLRIEGFTEISNTGLTSIKKENFEFTSGSYLFDKKDAYTLKLIEPFFQQNQTKKTMIGISPNIIGDSQPGETLNLQLKAEGGKGPYTFTAIESEEVFEESFTITARDASLTVIQNFVIPISENPGPLQIVTSDLKTGDQDEEYEFFLNGGGGTGNFTWGLLLNPSWLNIDPDTGKLFGTVPSNTRGITFVVTVTLNDGNSQTEHTYNLKIEQRVNVPLRFLTPTTLPNAVLGVPYEQSIQIEGGTGAITLSSSNLNTWIQFNALTSTLSGIPQRSTLQELTLPSGMALTEDGIFYGEVPTTNTYNFTIRVTDSRGIFNDQFYSWRTTGDARNSINFTTDEILPPAKLNTAYSQQLEVEGGFPPYSFSLTENSTLPPGIELSQTGLLAGITTLFSSSQKIHQPFYTFKIQAQDSAGNIRSRSFKFTVLPVIETSLFNSPAFDAASLIFYDALKFKYNYLENRGTPYEKKSKREAILNVEFRYLSTGVGTLTYRLNRLSDLFTTPDYYEKNIQSPSELYQRSLTFLSINSLSENLFSELAPLINLLDLQGSSKPIIKVTRGDTEIEIQNDETINALFMSKFSDLKIRITIDDTDNHQTSLTSTFNGITTEGIQASQFNTNPQTVPYVVTPILGTFNQSGVLITINLKADDQHNGIENFSFKIQVS